MALNLRGLAFDQVQKTVRRAVDDLLTRSLAAQPQSLVRQVAEYTVLADGHRWRPLVAVMAGLIFDPEPIPLVLSSACGIELAHAASLILDDLPSMDDATLRRGMPCPHHVFEPWAVDMAPVFMVTLAYRLSLSNTRVAADRRVNTALAMSMAGLKMISGQVVDLEQPLKEYKSENLIDCYRNKCASLYGVAALTGALSLGVDEGEAQKLYQCGLNLGMAYQFLDDIADVTATEKETLKTVGRDADKITAVDLYGLKGARCKVAKFRKAALTELEGYGTEADHLRTVIQSASWKS